MISLTFALSGCGSDAPVEEVTRITNFVSAKPPDGSISSNGSITVTFDNAPAAVTVSAGTVTVAGKIVTIAGPFPLGPLALKITWADGTQVLNYKVTTFCCAMPLIMSSTVIDGDTDVDPEWLNSDGKIEIFFFEERSMTAMLGPSNKFDFEPRSGWDYLKMGCGVIISLFFAWILLVIVSFFLGW